MRTGKFFQGSLFLNFVVTSATNCSSAALRNQNSKKVAVHAFFFFIRTSNFRLRWAVLNFLAISASNCSYFLIF